MSATTTGLSAFGLMEIEAYDYRGDPMELSALVLDIATYLIDAGPVIGDGDTVGDDEQTKIKVQYAASQKKPEHRVYRLSFV